MNEVSSGGRLRRSREEMYALIARYVASGQRQVDFCESEGVKVGTFQYWWHRYRREQESGSGGFVALSPQGSAPGVASEIELHYGSVHLQLRGVSSRYVAELVQALWVGC